MKNQRSCSETKDTTNSVVHETPFARAMFRRQKASKINIALGSRVDYALCSADLMEEIKRFSVLPFIGLSDHCCISMDIKINNVIDRSDDSTVRIQIHV